MTGYFGLTEESVNCTQPAIEDFPPDVFSKEQRQMGAIVLHAIGSLYLFLALAVVCDKYFVPAVEKICQALNMSNDVAGATFMAAATSAPELFVNVIGTFITEGDIGIGTIVGSAVFNILAVAACCGIGAGMVVPLDWWPLTRDCLAYGITVAILICIIHDERVEWYEALTLVLLYIVYIAVMYYDKSIQKCARGGVRHARSRSRRSHRGGSLPTDKLSHEQDRILPLTVDHFQQNGNIKNITHIDQLTNNNDDLLMVGSPIITKTDELYSKTMKGNPNASTTESEDLSNMNNDEQLELQIVSQQSTTTTNEIVSNSAAVAAAESVSVPIMDQQQQQSKTTSESPPTLTGISSVTAASSNDVDKDLPIGYSLIRYPKEKTCFRQIMWVVIWPIHLLFMFTIPDCERPRLKKLFPLTFLMCIIWIGSLSYMVAWMITIIGDTLQIPDSVMGITFLAAGTSVPEAVSSVIVAKQGHGSMGISNSIGSNTFDILLCLGLPWLIKASFLPTTKGLHWVAINSAGLEYSAISLLSTLLMLYAVFSFNKFKLDRKVGHTCLFMYAVFLVLATLIELNVFFKVNVPTCPSSK